MTLYTHSIVAHAHLLHPVQASDLINHFAKKLVSSLTVSSAACVKPRSKPTWRWLLQYVPLIESSCLAICSPFHVRKCPLSPVFSYSLSKKLVLSCMESAMTAVHRDRLVLASYAPWPMDASRSNHFQLPSVTDRQTDGHRTTIILIWW